METNQPKYLSTYRDGILGRKVDRALEKLKNCRLCPRNCQVDRTAGKTGICKTGRRAVVASYAPHFGEESPLVGLHGSGTIFFSHCNLLCHFCQNFDISHQSYGYEVTNSTLARIMIELQNKGCLNINFVTPSHVIPQILSAVKLAIGQGLDTPLVYNTSAYDEVDSLQLLDGVIDIYLPDFKFWDTEIANETCNAPDYPGKAKNAIREMHRQVGDLVIENGIAKRGLLVRHLVMPGKLADTREIMNFLANEISKNTYVNIMAQYRPCESVLEHPILSRKINQSEFEEALGYAHEAGLSRLD